LTIRDSWISVGMHCMTATPKFCSLFQATLAAGGIKPIQLPAMLHEFLNHTGIDEDRSAYQAETNIAALRARVEVESFFAGALVAELRHDRPRTGVFWIRGVSRVGL
jgi:hypothetical protein